MRCTWLAKLDTMTRPRVVRKTASMAGRQLALGHGEPGDLGVGRVDEEEVDPLLAQAGERPQVGDPAVERELVHLEVAGVQHEARCRADRDGEPVGDRVVDRDELAVERAEPAAHALLHLDGDRGDAVLGELGLEEGEREARADDGDVGALAQEVRHPADVVLVTVGQHDGVDGVEAVPDPREVGEDDVDPRLVLVGEEHPAVDDEQPPGVLEDRHVAADLAEAAERDDPQTVAGEGGQLTAAAAAR